jgi:ribosomal protein S18 acetylase RimI-like enzyme
MHLRPATPQDARAAADLVIAGDIEEVGEVDYSLGDLEDEWRELDLARDTLIVEDDQGTIVGCAHFRGHDLLGQVDPGRQGEGVGTAILDWAERRARERGAPLIRQGVGDRGHASRALLEARGYTRVRSFWRMERDSVPGETADDHGLRPAETPDAPRLHAIANLAFARDATYEPKPLDAWTRREFGGHDIDHALSRVALHDGEPVGFALARRWEQELVYVPLLAVDPDAQGTGIGARLLRSVFAAAAAAGKRQVRLNVASDNPNAVKLYERVGMRQAWRVDDYQKALPD